MYSAVAETMATTKLQSPMAGTTPWSAGVFARPNLPHRCSLGRNDGNHMRGKVIAHTALKARTRDLMPWRQNAGGIVVMSALPELREPATSTLPPLPENFPPFLPPQVQFLKEAAARDMACRMQRLPVQTSVSQQPILTSCVPPSVQATDKPPVLLLHGFDSSSLEWRRLQPLLEAGGVEAWAVDILGWGFSNTEGVSSFGVAAKREHIYEFWRAHIKRPMVLVGASLGGSIAIDFAVAHPDAVCKLVLIDAQGFAEGVGNLATMPKFLAYAGIAILKSVPLRSYANYLAFSQKLPIATLLDAMRVGRLHTLVNGWSDASVSFMLSGGYNVASCIPQVQQETLVIWGEKDKILPQAYALRFEQELPRSKLVFVKNAGHIPHVESPTVVADLLMKFLTSGLGEVSM